MTGFLYFLPGGPGAVGDMSRWGLGHVGKRLSSRQAHLPFGSGTMVCQHEFASRLEYKPDHQTWCEIPRRFASHPAYVGWWNDDKPTEKTLARDKQLPGDEVTLLDGQKWIVPRLRKYLASDQMTLVYSTELPTQLDYNDAGELLVGKVIPQYAEIWDRAINIAEALLEGAKDDSDLTQVDLIEFAGPLMSLNYHVSIFELIKLGIVGIDEAREVVRLALDMKGFEERLKNLLSRSESIGTNTPSGSELSSTDNPAITNQPSPI